MIFFPIPSLARVSLFFLTELTVGDSVNAIFWSYRKLFGILFSSSASSGVVRGCRYCMFLQQGAAFTQPKDHYSPFRTIIVTSCGSLTTLCTKGEIPTSMHVRQEQTQCCSLVESQEICSGLACSKTHQTTNFFCYQSTTLETHWRSCSGTQDKNNHLMKLQFDQFIYLTCQH